MHEVSQCATQKLKTWGFFNPAAPVLQTGHAVQRCNSHISAAIVVGVDRLSSILSSDRVIRSEEVSVIMRSGCHRSLLFFHIIYIHQICPVTSWNHAVNEQLQREKLSLLSHRYHSDLRYEFAGSKSILVLIQFTIEFFFSH